MQENANNTTTQGPTNYIAPMVNNYEALTQTQALETTKGIMKV